MGVWAEQIIAIKRIRLDVYKPRVKRVSTNSIALLRTFFTLLEVPYCSSNAMYRLKKNFIFFTLRFNAVTLSKIFL